MLSIPLNPTDEICIQIIHDYLLWHKVAQGIFKIINATSDSDVREYDGEGEHYGYFVAMKVLGISSNDALCEKLSDIVWQLHDTADYNRDLAETIYSKWVSVIKEEGLNSLKSA